MRFSIGLLREEPPRCRYHGLLLKPKVERAPMVATTGQLLQRPTRVVYRCKKKGCPWVACGEHSRIHISENSSGGNGLSTI